VEVSETKGGTSTKQDYPALSQRNALRRPFEKDGAQDDSESPLR